VTTRCVISAGDINGDGFTDVVTSSTLSKTTVWTRAVVTTPTLFPLTGVVVISSGNLSPMVVGAVDLDSDSDRDVIVVYQEFPRFVMYWFENLGVGGTRARPVDSVRMPVANTTFLAGLTSTHFRMPVVAADFDLGACRRGAHRSDAESHCALLADGADGGSVVVCARTRAPVSADGDMDLLCSCVGGSTTTLYWCANSGLAGTSRFGSSSPLLVGTASFRPDFEVAGVAAADFDRDGDIDVALGMTAGLVVFSNKRGTPASMFNSPTTLFSGSQSGSMCGVAVVDIEGDGVLV
jgi:hypothetical protein